MHIIGKINLFAVICLAYIPSLCLADDIDVGQIIEISENHEFIQVHDQLYKVDLVEIKNAEDSLAVGDRSDLAVGKIVRVTRGQKESGYYHSKLVTIFAGDYADEKREQMELSVMEMMPTEQTETSATDPYLENGVWKN